MEVTPLRQQYLDVKAKHPDCILFFRLGDFYETFDEDAEVAARELDLVLTGRQVNKGQRVPMAGVPYHALENYVARLIEKGYHVAVCEQITEPNGRGLVDRAVTLGESTSPNSLLFASLDAARLLAATRGRELLGETMEALAELGAAVRRIEGLDVLDESLVGSPGVFAYDPLRLAIDVRGTGASGYELARALREGHQVFTELAGENVIVCVFGMAEDAVPQGRRLMAALGEVVGALGGRGDRRLEKFAPPPPWGELAMSPRDAFLGAQEAVPVADAAGRIAAESLAAYPPGIPNVLPGERLTQETLDYIHTTLGLGGSLRGASDRALKTVRVVKE